MMIPDEWSACGPIHDFGIRRYHRCQIKDTGDGYEYTGSKETD